MLNEILRKDLIIKERGLLIFDGSRASYNTKIKSKRKLNKNYLII